MREFTIRLAEQADTDSIYAIMDKVSSSMEEPDLYMADDLAFIRRHIADSGFTLLAMYGQKPVGFLIVRIPGEDPDNLGRELGFNKMERSLVAHMDSAAVLPEYQGNRLQRRMVSAGETILASRGYQYAMATVSPRNFYSLRNMLSSGYRIAKTTLKYGGKERHILIKTLSTPA